MTTKHSINALIEYGDDNLLLDITYTMLPGSPASWDDPGCGPELEIVDIKLVESEDRNPPDKIILALAENWLHGDGFGEAIANATEDNQAAYEDAMEHRAETRREMRSES